MLKLIDCYIAWNTVLQVAQRFDTHKAHTDSVALAWALSHIPQFSLSGVLELAAVFM